MPSSSGAGASGRQRVQDGRLVDVGGGQRVVVGGRFDEGPSAAVQTERRGELVAEAAAGVTASMTSAPRASRGGRAAARGRRSIPDGRWWAVQASGQLSEVGMRADARFLVSCGVSGKVAATSVDYGPGWVNTPCSVSVRIPRSASRLSFGRALLMLLGATVGFIASHTCRARSGWSAAVNTAMIC